MIAAVAVAIFEEDRVLVLRRAAGRDAGPGIWETVSGRLAEGEQPLDAARREVAEETGLAVTLRERPVDAYVARRGSAPMIVVAYRADRVSGEVRRSSEHDAHEWLTVAELEDRGVPARLIDAIVAAARAGAAT